MWELTNNSKQTFSKAFNILALKLKVKPRRDQQQRSSSVLKELVTQPQSQADQLKDWLINLDRNTSEEKPKHKIRTSKRIKVSATPSIPNQSTAILEQRFQRRNSPFNILGQNLSKTTELYQEYMFLPQGSRQSLEETIQLKVRNESPVSSVEISDGSGSEQKFRKVVAPNQRRIVLKSTQRQQKIDPFLKEKLESLERFKALKVAERKVSLKSQPITISRSGKKSQFTNPS